MIKSITTKLATHTHTQTDTCAYRTNAQYMYHIHIGLKGVLKRNRQQRMSKKKEHNVDY